MKRFAVIVVLLLCVGLFQSASAQGGMMLGAEGNVALPNGDWSDFVSTGFGGTAVFMYTLAPNMAVGGHLGYLTFGGDKVEQPGGSYEYDYSAIPILGEFRYYVTPGPGPQFYVAGQAGFHRFSVTAKTTVTFLGVTSTQEASSSETDFSFAPTVGAVVGQLDINAFYMIISDANYIGLRLGYGFPIGP